MMMHFPRNTMCVTCFYFSVCRIQKSTLTSPENSKFLDDLSEGMKGQRRVPENLFCSLELIKGLSLVLPIQFVIMNDTIDSFTLREGAFPPTPPTRDGTNFYPDDNAQTIVLLHQNTSWDLIVPVRGREEEFW